MPVTRCLALLLAALAVASPASAAPRAQASEGPAVAIAAEVTAGAGRTVLSVTLSKPVPARSFAMEKPDRVIVDLAEVNFQLNPETGRERRGLVAAFRHGLFAPGRSRIVIDLAQPATVARVETSPRPDGSTLLEIELVRADREAFRKAAEVAEPPAPQGAAPARTEPAADRRPLIVLDPGHGGIDPGARSTAGVYEKDLVFSFAQQLRAKLEATGRYRVALTRDQDLFVPLDERVRLARNAKADLFVSIHADSISSAGVRGATVYTGSPKASDAESARLAERENKADAVAGLDAGDGADEVADILQDLTMRETRGFSRRLAGKLVGALDPMMRLTSNPHREAGFRVLRAPDVPSVLVELGYLSSRKDTDLIMSEEWRDKSAAAMTQAIDRFFSTRTATWMEESVPPVARRTP